MRQLAVRHRDRVLQRAREIPKAGAEDDREVRDDGDASPDGVGRLLDVVVVGRHSRNPAIVAVMKLASVPANIARKPSLARSCRRVGASPPMPPICMPIELKFAKPQSAN